MTCAETNLTLKADSNTFFFDRLGSNETLKLPLTFSASAGIQEGRYDIQLSMSYDNPDASSLSSSGTISVDIHQPLRVELEADELPDSINAGDTMKEPFTMSAAWWMRRDCQRAPVLISEA